MRVTSKVDWNKNTINLLRELWDKHLSAANIAAQIDGATRNAVLGKANRMGLQMRKTVNKNAPKKIHNWIVPHSKNKKVRFQENPPPEFEIAPPSGPLIPFIKLNSTVCRSIQGRDTDGYKLALFCSNPKDSDVSFCPYHMRQYYYRRSA